MGRSLPQVFRSVPVIVSPCWLRLPAACRTRQAETKVPAPTPGGSAIPFIPRLAVCLCNESGQFQDSLIRFFGLRHVDDVWKFLVALAQAHDRLEDNLNPVGRLYYSASTMICVPTSLAQEVGTALGAQAGEARLREVISKGGFTRMRRATETPFNMILEARP